MPATKQGVIIATILMILRARIASSAGDRAASCGSAAPPMLVGKIITRASTLDGTE